MGSKPRLEPFQHIRVMLDELSDQYPAQILDKNEQTINLRVSDALMRVENPNRITLLVGDAGYYMQCDTHVYAVYENWWFVHRPADSAFSTTQRRRFVRIRYEAETVLIPVNANGLPQSTPQTLKLANLSAEGCQCISPIPMFSDGDPVMVILSLPGMPVLSIQSKIRRVHQRTDQKTVYGIHFSAIAWDQREMLAHFIAAEIRNKARGGVDITTLQ